MAQQVFAYILHKDGVPDDTALELVTAAKKMFPGTAVNALVFGADADKVCNELQASYNEVWKINDASLAYPNAEIIRVMLSRILSKDSVVLIPHSTFGMDLAPGLSVKLDSPYIPDVVDVEEVSGGQLKAARQEFGGMANTHVGCDVTNGLVITIRAGSFPADESKSAGGQLADKSGDAIAGDIPVGRKFLEIVEAEVGDVDITKSDVLCSVGRGIEDKDNLEIVFDLAKAMGADVSCSRPIVDAKWLENARQVGTSGKTVKPKVYLALGISGAFQHMGGIKGSPFMVAVNKNPKAPIFQFADVGVAADILELVPELTEKISEMK